MKNVKMKKNKTKYFVFRLFDEERIILVDKPKAEAKKGKGNLACRLSLKSYGPPTPPPNNFWIV